MVDTNDLPTEETINSNESNQNKLRTLAIRNEMENEDRVLLESAEIPKVGMIFNTFEEIRDLYLKYASEKGFDISARSIKRDNEGEIKYCTIVCFTAGRKVCTLKSCLVSRTAVKKTDCKARITIRTFDDGKLYISGFSSKHNHESNPENSRYNAFSPRLGVSVTKQNENAKAYFDDYIKPEITLKQFMEQYNTILRGKIEKEEYADFTSSSSIIPAITDSQLEKQFQNAYTNEICKLLQEELRSSSYWNASMVTTMGHVSTFVVTYYVKREHGPRMKTVNKVIFDNVLHTVWCNCCLFEFRRILCRHALAVLFDQDVKEVPSYIFWPDGGRSLTVHAKGLIVALWLQNSLSRWCVLVNGEF